MKRQIRTCYISAPAGANLHNLHSALHQRDIQVLLPGSEASNPDRSEARTKFANVDLVIGVLTRERRSQWVLFELGQASAFDCEIVLLVPPGKFPVPFDLRRFLVLRIGLDNQDAIRFAIDQLLASPKPSDQSNLISLPRKTLGLDVDRLTHQLHQAIARRDERQVGRIVFEALNKAGADLIAEASNKDRGADFAVWSDELQPYVGNPLLVELKSRIKGPQEVEQVSRQLLTSVLNAGAIWGLLLYVEGPPPDDRAWKRCPPTILRLSVGELFERLRSDSFADVIIKQRNARAHGGVL